MSHVERECLAILTYLSEKGYTDLHTIAQETMVSYANVQRYLRKDAWEVAPAVSASTHPGTVRERQEAWLLLQRKVNPSLYWRYLPTLRPVGDVYKINRSKLDILHYYAHLHHFTIHPSDAYPGFTVQRQCLSTYNGEMRDTEKASRDSASSAC